MSDVEDGGPVHPVPFIYMVNSMANKRELHDMAQEFSERIRDMPKGISLRDVLVGQALSQAAAYVGRHDKPREDRSGWDKWWVDEAAVKNYVDAAEALADEYLRRRAKRKEKE